MLLVAQTSSVASACTQCRARLQSGTEVPPQVESRTGAGTDTAAPPRFPSPLIKPDVPTSAIRLSDGLPQSAMGSPGSRAYNFAAWKGSQTTWVRCPARD